MAKKMGIIGLVFIVALLAACGSGSDATLTQAESYLAQGDYRNAMLTLKNMIQSNPENQAARLLLGKIYLPIGDGASAEKELRRAQKSGAPAKEITANLAKALLLQGKVDEALDIAKPIDQAANVTNAEILSVQGNALLAKGKIKVAEAAYQRALDLDRLSNLALQGLVKVAVSGNKLDKANAAIGRLMAVAPKDASAWSLKGAVLGRQQKPAEAENSYQQAVGFLNEQQMTRKGFAAYMGLVQMQLIQRKFDEALPNVKKLRTSQPNHPIPRYMRAVIAFEQKDYKLSLEHLTEILRRVRNHIPSQLLAGTVHYALGNYEQAREQLERVVNAVPSHLQARKLLAAVHMKLRNPEDALEVLQTEQTADTDDAQLLAMMGKAALYSGDLNASLAMYKKAVKSSPDATAIRAELARLYMSKGAYGDAVAELEKIEGKGESQAKRMKIYALIRGQKYDKAIATTKELAAENPKDPLVPTIFGAIELSRGERGKARQFFLKARDLQPGYEAALLSLAQLDLEEGELDKADAWYNEIILKNSESLRAMLGMAQIAERRGQTDQALIWVEKANKANPKVIAPVAVLANYHIKARQFKQADDIIASAEQLQAGHPELLKLRAKSLFAQGKTREAGEAINELIKLQPKNVTNYLQLAQIHSSTKNFEKARETLRRAAQVAPNAPALNVALVRVETQLGNVDNALKVINEQKKLPKSRALAYSLEGDVYAQQKQYKKAEAAYKKGMAINDVASFAAKLAMVRNQAGNLAGAKAIIASWVKKHPKGVKGQAALAQIYMQMDAQPEAIALYERINQAAPNNPVVLNNLAWLYSEQNDPRALETAEQAYRLATTSSSIMDTYGWLLTQKGELGRGIDILREAVSLSGQHPEIQLHLATALVKQGSMEEEARALVKAIQADGRLNERADVQQLASKLGL